MSQKLSKEKIVTLTVLKPLGQSNVQIARTLGVTEGTVRYHLRREASGAEDGRRGKARKADEVAGYIEACQRAGVVRVAGGRGELWRIVQVGAAICAVEVSEAEVASVPAGGDAAWGAGASGLGGVPGSGPGRRSAEAVCVFPGVVALATDPELPADLSQSHPGPMQLIHGITRVRIDHRTPSSFRKKVGTYSA